MPWPVGLKEKFDKFDDETLAWASRVIYFYGHWAYRTSVTRKTGGATWKFAHLADQLLRERCGLPVTTGGVANLSGYSFQIHDGFIRCRHSTNDHWLWEEVGLASRVNLEKARKALHAAYLDNSLRGPEDIFAAIKKVLTPSDSSVAAMLDTKLFNIPEELDKYRREKGQEKPTEFKPLTKEGKLWVLAEQLGIHFSRMDILVGNPRVIGAPSQDRRGRPMNPNHYFVIGSTHMKNAVNGRLTGHEAPCDLCGLSIDRHVSESVVSISGYDVKEHTDDLPKLIATIDALKDTTSVKGFCFESVTSGKYVVMFEDMLKLTPEKKQ